MPKGAVSLLSLVRRYQRDFERFGPIRFESRVKRTDKRGGEPTEFAMLNEGPSMLLLAFMRKTARASCHKRGIESRSRLERTDTSASRLVFRGLVSRVDAVLTQDFAKPGDFPR